MTKLELPLHEIDIRLISRLGLGNLVDIKQNHPSIVFTTTTIVRDHTMADAKPLVTTDFFADPSGRVFNDRLYIYPSHDRRTSIPDDDNGSQYDMADYHVLSMNEIGGEVKVHGKAFGVEDVPWAAKQLWAPDCGFKNGKYYFYFPARDHEGVFRIGVAVSETSEGPFKPERGPIEGSFSIDPAVLVDENGEVSLDCDQLDGGS